MEKLYQEIILDHYRTPHHFGLREPFDTEVHHVNPTCGDEVTLRVRLDPADVRDGADVAGRGDLVVADISYDALGCSISQASTSVLTDLAIGRPLDRSAGHPGGVHRDGHQPRARSRVTRTCWVTASPSPGSRSTRRG